MTSLKKTIEIKDALIQRVIEHLDGDEKTDSLALVMSWMSNEHLKEMIECWEKVATFPPLEKQDD